MKFSVALATILALLTLVAAQEECHVYIPNEDNIIYMDAEQRGSGGGWEYQTTPEGWLGSGVLSYKPMSSFGGTEWKPQNFRDERIKTFSFRVNEPGMYRVLLRSSAPHITEHNDVWMSLPESGSQMTNNGVDFFPIAAPITTEMLEWDYVDQAVWFKVYQNRGGDLWDLGGYTLDFDPHSIVTQLITEVDRWYSVRIAGRSTQFDIDRIVVHKCEGDECAYSVGNYGIAVGYSGPQSTCVEH